MGEFKKYIHCSFGCTQNGKRCINVLGNYRCACRKKDKIPRMLYCRDALLKYAPPNYKMLYYRDALIKVCRHFVFFTFA